MTFPEACVVYPVVAFVIAFCVALFLPMAIIMFVLLMVLFTLGGLFDLAFGKPRRRG